MEGGEVGGQRKQAWGEEAVQSPREVCDSCSDGSCGTSHMLDTLITCRPELCSRFGGCTMFARLLKG